MKKTNQNLSKQHLNGAQQLPQGHPTKKMAKIPSKQLNYSANIRFFQSHPFSQTQKQQFSFSRVYNRNYTDSRCQPYHKDYSQYYKKKSGPSQIVTSENIALLQQRLRNIREHYETLINEQKVKNAQRSEVIMGLILEMQATHNEKMQVIRKAIHQNQQEKKDVGFVDEKMTEIKGNIDELINQSNTLKQQNEELEKQIAEKLRENQQKQADFQQLSQQVLDARTQLQQFQLTNLKNNKINKQIMEIFNSASTLSSN